MNIRESLPDVDYWEQIPDAAGFDIVICIRWSRLGRSSAPALRMPDDTEAGSYTGQESPGRWTMPRKAGVPVPARLPQSLATDATFGTERGPRSVFVREWDGSQAFFTRWEKSSEENFASVCHNYWNLQGFEQLFREHFRSFLVSKLDREAGHKVLGRGVRRWKTCPFRGLSFFDFEHAPIFHGRTKAIGEVLEALEAQVRAHEPFVLIIGSSGSGKSSLMRAGVLPLLTQPETIDGVELWRWAVTNPELVEPPVIASMPWPRRCWSPLRCRRCGTRSQGNAIRDLATELRDHADSVALRVRDALDHVAREWKIQKCHSLKERERQLRELGRSEHADLAGQRRRLELPKTRLALAVDQLEELFTAGFSPEVCLKYVSTLVGLVRSGRVFVLAALRSDFYPRYQEFPDLIELAKPSGKFDLPRRHLTSSGT